MLTTYVNKLRWSYRKNWPDIKGLVARHYPAFIFANGNASLGDEIPVFVFHSVEPRSFRAQLDFLRRNRYVTLDGDTFLAVLQGDIELPERAVVLTFDDGTASLYSVAWPLLREYGFRAISFIIPGCIPETAPETPTLDEVAAGKAREADLLQRERGDEPLCSWQEIAAMHASGVIDFQAHTMHHHLINVSPQLVDFIHPRFDFYFYANINVPVYYHDGEPDYRREPGFGTPVYRTEPRMSGRRQYFDDEALRQVCTEFVQQRGGADFFSRKDWRKQLAALHKSEAASTRGRYESDVEMQQAIYNDFARSKAIIERHLSGKSVEHFCFPWFIGSPMAMEAAAANGFKALYWGILPDVRCNRPGNDPAKIVRLEDRYIYRLPGEGRVPLRTLLAEKVGTYLPLFKRRLLGTQVNGTTTHHSRGEQ